MSAPSTTQKMHELAGLLLDREDAAVSPLSIELCLAMLLAGATVDTHDVPDAPDAPDADADAPAPDADPPAQPSSSDTHRQLYAALGLDPAHEHHFLDSCKQKRAELTAEVADIQVDMASALFCAAGIKDTYTALCAERLDAHVLPLASSAGINEWVAERTKGMITEVLTEDPPGPLVLVQTLVFDAKFTYLFDPAKTRPAMFDRRGPVPGRNWRDQSCATDPVEVQMMTMTANLRYTGDNGVQVVELPYGKPEDGRSSPTSSSRADSATSARPSRRSSPTTRSSPKSSTLSRTPTSSSAFPSSPSTALPPSPTRSRPWAS